jgi:hypothetical protein
MNLHPFSRSAPLGNSSRTCEEHDWRKGLPLAWLAQVVRPVFFTLHREYEIRAERVIGYETEDQPCYCRHEVVISELRTDDDEHWFMMPVYAEHLAGWRLVDDRWLIRRQVSSGEDCSSSRAFFTLATEMPR